jgi:hypothetical protein
MGTSHEYSDEGSLCAFCESLYHNSDARIKLVLGINTQLTGIRGSKRQVRRMEREGRERGDKGRAEGGGERWVEGGGGSLG